MPRLDVYPMPGKAGRGYVLDVQANLLDDLKTRVVVPLVAAAEAPLRMRELNPVFEINGTSYVMLTQALATVPLKELGKAELSLDAHHDAVTRALDLLLIGY